MVEPEVKTSDLCDPRRGKRQRPAEGSASDEADASKRSERERQLGAVEGANFE